MNNSILSRRLKEARAKKGLSQRQLASILDVAPSVISGAETKRGISKSLASKLADYFETDIEYWTNENAEKEYIKQAKLFEMTRTVVFRLIDEGILTEEAFDDSEVMDLIIQALKVDIKVILKRKGI